MVLMTESYSPLFSNDVECMKSVRIGVDWDEKALRYI